MGGNPTSLDLRVPTGDGSQSYFPFFYAAMSRVQAAELDSRTSGRQRKELSTVECPVGSRL